MSNDQHARKEFSQAFEPLTELARQSFADMTPEQCLRGEAAIAERLARARRTTRRPVWRAPALACGACALACGVCALALGVWQRTRYTAGVPLSYVVENGTLGELRSSDKHDEPARVVHFSDGTEVRVDNGAEASVRTVTNHGALVTMARGALHAQVVHTPSSDWRFDAGPFVVRVTGTAFGLAWDPDQDRFDLRLEHGSVTVTSPVANDPIPLRAGQWLTIRPHTNEVFIRDFNSATPSVSSSAAPEAAGAPSGVPVPPGSAFAPSDLPGKAHPASELGHHWAQDLVSGKIEFIVDDAQRRGIDNCLAEGSSSELAALADAARYSRHDRIARKTMLAERQRFPGSSVAIDAGLLLGRLAETEYDDRQALHWFDTYLSEAPTGRFASEALGRKMALVRRSMSTSAAQAIAEEYLAKFPSGTYASAARAILKSP